MSQSSSQVRPQSVSQPSSQVHLQPDSQPGSQRNLVENLLPTQGSTTGGVQSRDVHGKFKQKEAVEDDQKTLAKTEGQKLRDKVSSNVTKWKQNIIQKCEKIQEAW